MTKHIKTYYRCDTRDRYMFKLFLIEHNITAEAVALTLGISDSLLSAVINGKRNINKELIINLKKIGFDLEEVLDNDK